MFTMLELILESALFILESLLTILENIIEMVSNLLFLGFFNLIKKLFK